MNHVRILAHHTDPARRRRITEITTNVVCTYHHYLLLCSRYLAAHFDPSFPLWPPSTSRISFQWRSCSGQRLIAQLLLKMANTNAASDVCDRINSRSLRRISTRCRRTTNHELQSHDIPPFFRNHAKIIIINLLSHEDPCFSSISHDLRLNANFTALNAHSNCVLSFDRCRKSLWRTYIVFDVQYTMFQYPIERHAF